MLHATRRKAATLQMGSPRRVQPVVYAATGTDIETGSPSRQRNTGSRYLGFGLLVLSAGMVAMQLLQFGFGKNLEPRGATTELERFEDFQALAEEHLLSSQTIVRHPPLFVCQT